MIRKSFSLLREFSAFLLAGTAFALIWANVDFHSYHEFIENPVWKSIFFSHSADPAAHPLEINFHFIVNDIFMVLFFGMAMKEVSESFLPGGALSSASKAAMPAIATMGGIVGPVAVFFFILFITGYEQDISSAWAIPTATDIAYSWLFAGLIFGRKHPAVTFLLVLAVLDDLIGMIIIAVFYSGNIHFPWLLVTGAGILIAEVFRRFRIKNFWFYVLIPGVLSWLGLMKTGVHASLALVPIIPFMPHSARDTGMFDETNEKDTMNQYEHFFSPIVDVGLFFFGLANAGVHLSGGAIAAIPTWSIFLALIVGKTVGIFSFGLLSKLFGLKLPDRMGFKDLFVMGMVAGIGFTVALFVSTVAMKTNPTWLENGIGDELKLGALLSFFSGFAAIVLGLVFRIKKIEE